MPEPSSEAPAPPSVGLVAGKYELVQMIGRGGMGSVWEARHASLGTRFAIKFIESEYAESQEARSRFDKEARAAATIQSKHAIQIYDHGVTDDGKPYIVMELLQGEPLDKRIERLGTMTLQDTARVLQQVCRGLVRAHERGIVHRDLKPENIFVVRSTEDDEEIAKVLDFGIAKIQSGAHNPGLTSSTKTGAVLGTPFYMSPEQARGLRNVDHRTDVWSLGVIAFKCVTGRLPFDGESVGDLLVKICTAPLPIPTQIAPSLPSSFDAWFFRALEREPDRRFASVTELAEHLAFVAGVSTRVPSSLVGLPPSAMVSSGGAPPATTTPMNMGPAIASSMTPQPIAGMTASPFTSSQPVPGVPSGSGRWFLVAALVGLAVAGGGVTAYLRLQQRLPTTHLRSSTESPVTPPLEAATTEPATSATGTDTNAKTEPPHAKLPTDAHATKAAPGADANAKTETTPDEKPKPGGTKRNDVKPPPPPAPPSPAPAPVASVPQAPVVVAPPPSPPPAPVIKRVRKDDPGY